MTCLDIERSFLSFHIIHELLLYDMIQDCALVKSRCLLNTLQVVQVEGCSTHLPASVIYNVHMVVSNLNSYKILLLTLIPTF